jgi:hypothetical protein
VGNVIIGINKNGNFLDGEIDASLFFKIKHNRGRVRNLELVFDEIEKSVQCFYSSVK